MRRVVLVGALLVAACRRDAPPPAVTDGAAPGVARDVQATASELYELVDRAVEYRSAHRGKAARTLRQVGLDSLTPTSDRRMTSSAPIQFTVVRRRPGTVSACSAGEEILEQAALNDGRFTIRCDTPSGAAVYDVSRAAPAPK
ncbi:MAG: hypothetical protein MUC69_02030 [Gemmatimonadales bacterium]|nr:hypothetical protein [Gemmatimonadales bacterium]